MAIWLLENSFSSSIEFLLGFKLLKIQGINKTIANLTKDNSPEVLSRLSIYLIHLQGIFYTPMCT